MEFQDRRNEHFMKLYEPHHSSALAYAWRLTGNDDEARDLLQDALEAALRGFAGLRRAESFKPWFFRVLRNRHLNKARRAKLANRYSFNFEIEHIATLREDSRTGAVVRRARGAASRGT
jgi:RNA polymerase sigma factor (sigma-70 family)